MRDLALTSSCLPLFIAANKTENNVYHRGIKPGTSRMGVYHSSTEPCSNMTYNVRIYASYSYCAIRNAIAPAHFSPGPGQCTCLSSYIQMYVLLHIHVCMEYPYALLYGYVRNISEYIQQLRRRSDDDTVEIGTLSRAAVSDTYKLVCRRR